MNRRLHLLWLPQLLHLCACTTYEVEYFTGSERYEVSRVTREDGSIEKYLLEVSPTRAGANLEVITEYDRKRAFLGLRVKDLDPVEAERRGIKPYQGLLVTGTYPQSGAEAAGMVAGDVLLLVDAAATVSADRLPQIEASLRAGQPVKARVLRGQSELELHVQPTAFEERIIDPQVIPLESAPHQRPFAGIALRQIPRVWAERMFGDDRNGVVVAGVDMGSPAWVAGFRPGDLLEAVDGGAVPPAEDLARLIASRGEACQAITLRASRGAADRHEATIELSDYRATKQVWLPLVFRVKDSAYEDHWSVGPFGMICNNWNSYTTNGSSREPTTRNVFNALLGAFRVERGAHTSLRLLWLIEIGL